MSKKERKEAIKEIAVKFTELEEKDKSFIVGYMTGINEERAKWECQQQKPELVARC